MFLLDLFEVLDRPLRTPLLAVDDMGLHVKVPAITA